MTRNEQIIQAVQSGLTYREVAEKLNVSRSTVAGVCYRASGKRKGRDSVRSRYLKAVELVRSGATFREACDATGAASTGNLSKYCKAAGVSCSPRGRRRGIRSEKIAHAVRLVMEVGMTYREAAWVAGAPSSFGTIYAAVKEIRDESV